ncbi:MAG: hypothetical protein KGJ92_01870 [Actinomycetales bacterium]|nr:hypothetical protein [Actinomycetales bacterium]
MGDLLNGDADIQPTPRRRPTRRFHARTGAPESPARHPSTAGFNAHGEHRLLPVAVDHGPAASGESVFDERSLPIERRCHGNERSTVRGHRVLEGADASRASEDEGPTGFSVRSRTRRGRDGYRWIAR